MDEKKAAEIINRAVQAIGAVLEKEPALSDCFVAIGIEAEGKMYAGSVGRGRVPLVIFQGVRSLPNLA